MTTDAVPAPIAAAVERYVAHRGSPAEYLRAIIANDLLGVTAYAPADLTMADLRATVRLVFNAVPGRARGSKEAVAAWIGGRTPSPTEKDPRP